MAKAKPDLLTQLRAVAEMMPDAIALADLSGRLVYHNPASLALHGYASLDEAVLSGDEAVKQWEGLHLEGNPVTVDDLPMPRALRGETFAGYELLLRRRDTGKTFIGSYSGMLVRDNAGRPLYGLITIRDVTREKEIQDALRESEQEARRKAEELDALMNLIPASVLTAHDPRCEVVTGNETANRTIGAVQGENISAGEDDGESPHQSIRFFRDEKELRPEELPLQVAVREDVVLKNLEVQLVTPAGDRISLLGNARPLHDEKGNVRGAISAFIDVTDRKRMENQLHKYRGYLEDKVDERTSQLEHQLRRLREAEGNLDLVIDSMPEGILVIDESGIVLFSNPAAGSLFGRVEEELAGAPFGYPLLTDMAELAVPTHDGEIKVVEMLTVPINWKDRECSLVLLRDVTARKEAEQRAWALSKRLIDSQERERRRIGHALHDEVGGTLTALRLSLERVQRHHAEDALPVLQHIGGIIDDLAEQVRQISHAMRPGVLDDYGLPEALRWYLERYQERTGIQINFSHSPINCRLPAETETTAYRIVQEAVNNAAKHSGAASIDVAVSCEQDILTGSISDSGRGFDPSETGDGAGLPGMQDLAELTGGWVAISSSPGEGTLVSFELPVIPATQEAI